MNIGNGLTAALAVLAIVSVFPIMAWWFTFCYSLSGGSWWGFMLWMGTPLVIGAFFIGAFA